MKIRIGRKHYRVIEYGRLWTAGVILLGLLVSFGAYGYCVLLGLWLGE